MKMLKGINPEQHGPKPKKAMSPYIAYVKTERPVLTKMQPQMGFGEAMKYLAERWKVMNDEMKYPYYQMAMKD